MSPLQTNKKQELKDTLNTSLAKTHQGDAATQTSIEHETDALNILRFPKRELAGSKQTTADHSKTDVSDSEPVKLTIDPKAEAEPADRGVFNPLRIGSYLLAQTASTTLGALRVAGQVLKDSLSTYATTDRGEFLGKGFWLVLLTSAGSAGGVPGMLFGATLATASATIIGDWVGGKNKECKEASISSLISYAKKLYRVFRGNSNES